MIHPFHCPALQPYIAFGVNESHNSSPMGENLYMRCTSWRGAISSILDPLRTQASISKLLTCIMKADFLASHPVQEHPQDKWDVALFWDFLQGSGTLWISPLAHLCSDMLLSCQRISDLTLSVSSIPEVKLVSSCLHWTEEHEFGLLDPWMASAFTSHI